MLRTTQLQPTRRAEPRDLVGEVLRSPGQPLDAATRSLMDPRFGQEFSRIPAHTAAHSSGRLPIIPPDDPSEREAATVAGRISHSSVSPRTNISGPDFSGVRIHIDSNAARSAASVNARAYTVGNDIVFGSGQYAPRSVEGQRLLAHELVHTIQQSSNSNGLALQRDVIDDVREKMSYGLTDWAVTDAEALESLALLGAIDPAKLESELKRLGSKYVTRLLDNLPDSAKTGDVYKRVLEALGPAQVTPYAVDQLSYGVLDWRISDEEVTRVYNTLVNLPATQQEQFLANLNAEKRLARLIDNSTQGHHTLYVVPWLRTVKKGTLTPQQRDILRVIVENSGADKLETLKTAVEVRFNVAVGPSTIPDVMPVTALDGGKLRQTYLILDTLPESHVANNKELLSVGQFTEEPSIQVDPTTGAQSGSITAGVYNGGKRELAVNVKSFSDVEGTLRHETGHAVDKQLGWSAGAEPAKPQRGGWKTYGISHEDCATDMVDDAAGSIKTTLTVDQRKDVIKEMAKAMPSEASAASLLPNVRALPWFSGLPVPDQTALVGDRALAAVEIGLKKPYSAFPTTGGEHLGPHIYQAGYPPDWVRYQHAARARMLRDYQFRDPHEWFAEAYRAYYTPDSRGKGEKLKDKDPDTKTYFDNVVDKIAPSR